MGQTNKYKLPYPEANDYANVPEDMQNLAEKVEDIYGGIESAITDAYDATKTYPLGSYCIYNNILYKCKTAITTAEEFNESKWEATNIAKEVGSLDTKTEDLDTRIMTQNVFTPGTNLNDYVQDGRWFFNNANTPVNKPADATSNAGYLEVINRNTAGNTETLQRWTTGNRFEIFIRQKFGGTWGTWGKLLAENDINMITGYLKENYTIANNDTVEYLANFDEYNKVGNKLTIENGKIKIGAGVSKVKVYYSTTTRSNASTVRTFTYIVHNTKSITQESHYYATINSQISVSHNAITMDVSQGDTFDVAVYGAVGNKVMGGPKTSLLFTSITVEVIK